MTNDIAQYVLAWIVQNTEPGMFQLMTEPVKMLAEECIKAALAINMDESHPFIMTCVPFTEAVTEVVQ